MIVKIQIDGSETDITNDSEALAALCSSLPEKAYPEMITALADHHSADVQCAIASRSDLSEAAVEALVKSQSKQVRRRLVDCTTFHSTAKTELLLEWCSVDEELAADIARRIMYFENADTRQLFAALSSHRDPSVRRALAETWNLPKSYLKLLVSDSDVSVARTALYNLG